MRIMMKDGILHVLVPGAPARGGWQPCPALTPRMRPGRFTLRTAGKRPPLRAVARAQAARWKAGR